MKTSSALKLQLNTSEVISQSRCATRFKCFRKPKKVNKIRSVNNALISTRAWYNSLGCEVRLALEHARGYVSKNHEKLKIATHLSDLIYKLYTNVAFLAAT